MYLFMNSTRGQKYWQSCGGSVYLGEQYLLDLGVDSLTDLNSSVTHKH